jgi:apolipoprotein N-acyltransferase
VKIKIFKNKTALTKAQKKERRKDRFLLMLSGALMGLSFPPVPFPLFMFFGLAPYLSVIEKREKLREVNFATYLMAFVFTLVSVYWVGGWQVGKDEFLMIGGALLMFINPLFFLIASTLLYFSRGVFKKTASLFLFPIYWVAYEYAYMVTDASFPWLTLGNGLSHFNLFIQPADIIGAMGLSAVVVYINIFIYKAAVKYKTDRRAAYYYSAGALLLIIVPVIYGAVKVSSFKSLGEKVKIGLIQPDIDPYEKWAGRGLEDFTDEYFALSKKAVDDGAEVLVWPETALPVYLFSGNYQGTVVRIKEFLRRNNVQLLTGMPDLIYFREGDKMPPDVKQNRMGTFHYATYNAVLLVDPYCDTLQRYGKMKLVPFGERVPFVDELPFLGAFFKWEVGISGWNVGRDTSVFNVSVYNKAAADSAPVFLSPVPGKKQSFKVNACVCYESVYPAFIAQFTQKGARLITVVTNDSWYGNSSGPYQHKEISALRAVENRRGVIRAANGGISCYINPIGVTERATSMYEKNYLVADVVLQDEMTFFAKHPLLVPAIASVFSVWVVGLFIIIRIKNRLERKTIVKSGNQADI